MHTPGPWQEDPELGIGARAVIGDGQQLVALVYGRSREEQTANVRAIVAGLDAVAELERITGLLDTWAKDHQTERTSEIDAAIYCARAVITKAR